MATTSDFSMYKHNDNVVVKRNDGSSHSGKVLQQIGDDFYMVAYIFNGGVRFGKFHVSRITPMNDATFLVTESSS